MKLKFYIYFIILLNFFLSLTSSNDNQIIVFHQKKRDWIDYANFIANTAGLGVIAIGAYQLWKYYDKKKLFSDKKNQYSEYLQENYKNVYFKDLANGDKIKAKMQSIIDYSNNYNNYKINNIKGTNGIILYGPTGTGKSSCIYALANEINVDIISLSKINLGNSKALQEINEKIKKKTNNNELFILLFDNIGNLFELTGDFVEFLSKSLDNSHGIIFAITSDSLESISPLLLRSGRFNIKIQMKLPKINEINEIVIKRLDKYNFEINSPELIQKYLLKLGGVSQADVARLVDRIVEIAFLDNRKDLLIEDFEKATLEILNERKLVGKFKPIYPDQTLSLKDIGGMSFIKNDIKDIIEYFSNPKKRAEYKAKKVSPAKGILFYGPPGTGKTFIAKVIANLANIPIFIVSAAELSSKWVGESEKDIKELFEVVRASAPAILLIDEIDSLLPDRNNKNMQSWTISAINTFLSELDGLSSLNDEKNEEREDVLVIGTTNRIKGIDPAALRSGRLEKQILIENPKEEARKEIIEIYIKKYEIKFTDKISIEYLVKKLDGNSPADISAFFNLLAQYLIKENKVTASLIDINEVYENQSMGLKTEYSESIEDTKFTAYHEAGHAIVLLHSKYSPYEFDILTVIPRGGALGYLSYRYAKGDNKNLNRNEFLNSIDIALGGRAVEEILFDSPEAGASSDLKKATKIAKIMLIKLGMHGKLVVQKDANSKEINEEVDKILQERYEIVKEIIKNNKEIIHDIVKELMIKKTLNIKDIERIFKKHGRKLPEKTKRNLIK